MKTYIDKLTGLFAGKAAACLFIAVSTLATQTTVAKAPAQPPVEAESVAVSLSDLRVRRGPIRLNGAQNEEVIVFPTSSREQLSNVEMALYVTNSISLTRRSQMAVSINGSVIGQVSFSADRPEIRARLAIPAKLLNPGYNRIKFSVAQHYTENCEDPTAPELWSEIDTVRSEITYAKRPVPAKALLSELPLLMDKRLKDNYTLVIATTDIPSHTLVEAGALVSQAAALSRDYAPVAIEHRVLDKRNAIDYDSETENGISRLPRELFSGHDGILLGTRDELRPWLSDEAYQRSSQPLLGIYPYGESGEHFVMVVSGADESQVRQASSVLVKAYSSLPPAQLVNVGGLSRTRLKQRPTLRSAGSQPFNEFGYKTVTRQGVYPEAMKLRFWVPADRFARPNSEVRLHLHMAYGAGLGPQSTINVFLNNHFEHAIHLTEEGGAVYYDYRIPVPVSSLTPGWNQLEFRPRMMPLRQSGQCDSVYTDNLLLTLFDDSYLESDDMGRLAQLPDLSLFSATAFPFSGSEGDAALSIVRTGLSSGNTAATWSLLAKLAQVNSSPLMRLRSTTADEAKGNILIVGQAKDVPEELLQASSLDRDSWLSLGNERRAATSAELLNILMPADALASEGVMKVSVGELLSRSMLISQFESPRESERSIVMVLSASAERLSGEVNRLVSGRLWGSLDSGTTVITREGREVFTYPAPENYLVGSAGTRARLSHSFERHPALAIAFVLAGLLLFSLVTWRLLIAYRRRHHIGETV